MEQDQLFDDSTERVADKAIHEALLEGLDQVFYKTFLPLSSAALEGDVQEVSRLSKELVKEASVVHASMELLLAANTRKLA